MLDVGEGEGFRVLYVITPMVVMGLGVSIAIFIGIFRVVLGLIGYRDVVVVVFMFELDSVGEVRMVVVPGFALVLVVKLLILFFSFIVAFFMVDEWLVVIFGLDHPYLGLFVAHNLNYITINAEVK